MGPKMKQGMKLAPAIGFLENRVVEKIKECFVKDVGGIKAI